MSIYEDDAMELIETVPENSHHNAAKLFGRGAMPKGQMIDAKSAKTQMLLRKNRQNGGSPEFTTTPTQHWQWFRRTRPRLTSRGVTVCQLLKILSQQIRLPRNGDPRARHVLTRSIKRTNSTGTIKLSGCIP